MIVVNKGIKPHSTDGMIKAVMELNEVSDVPIVEKRKLPSCSDISSYRKAYSKLCNVSSSKYVPDIKVKVFLPDCSSVDYIAWDDESQIL